MHLNFFQGIMGRSPIAESVITFQKIRFEDRFQDQERRHLDHTISYRRDAQWPPLSICFLDPDPTHWSRLVSFLLERLLDLVQKSLNSAFAFFNHLDRDAVHPGRSLIGSHP